MFGLKILFMTVKEIFGLFKNGLRLFLWLVYDRFCELVCDYLWNVQKIFFRGCFDKEKNSVC